MRSRIHRFTLPLALTAASLTGASALAHHSFAMFDQSKELELHGAVREFQWTNPHVWIEIQVREADGQSRQWSIEASSPNNLRRRGWTATSLKPGDAVTARIHPLRSGSPGGSLLQITTANGTQLVN